VVCLGPVFDARSEPVAVYAVSRAGLDTGSPSPLVSIALFRGVPVRRASGWVSDDSQRVHPRRRL